MILGPSVLELSSDNHLVDGQTDRPTDMSKAIYPLFFEVGHNKTNVVTKLHDDWAKIVTSRVFTRFLYSQIRKTAPPTAGHVFQRTGTTFKLNQHIIKANI
ncbi:hypothetical protein DPMN_121747 [Dreissena polymorpha]|uniref:Uncharacterized protein n=1 Tax=Dreissena polymorpha TaxID=45954 RepID=A0A9D4GQM7_DREPO|nr:hypothetical protein DPMN_121747 [Dreissena polymorpha]